MKKIRLSDASLPLAFYVADLNEEIVLVTRGTRAVAALVPLPDGDSYESKLMKNPTFLSILAKSRAQFAAGQFETEEEAFRLAELPKGSTTSSRSRSRRT